MLAPRLNPDKPKSFEQMRDVTQATRRFEELRMPPGDLTFVTVLTL
jgi:hypothetical protein